MAIKEMKESGFSGERCRIHGVYAGTAARQRCCIGGWRSKREWVENRKGQKECKVKKEKNCRRLRCKD